MGPFHPKKRANVTMKNIGDKSEACIIAKLMQVGYAVLIPFGGSERYDLVIEDADGQFWRVQCKTGRYEVGTVEFNTGSTNDWYYRKRIKVKDYQGQIDYFAVYCPQLETTYLVPVDHVGTSQARLRVGQLKHKQEKGIRWAADYEL